MTRGDEYGGGGVGQKKSPRKIYFKSFNEKEVEIVLKYLCEMFPPSGVSTTEVATCGGLFLCTCLL